MALDLSHACVICQATNNLNTHTTIKMAEDEYNVAVCAGCEDTASPKAIRANLTTILEKITSLCGEIGKYLGITITLSNLIAPPPPAVPIVAMPSTTPAVVDHNGSQQPSSANQGGVKVVSRPIQRDQKRRPGNPQPPPSRQKVSAQPRDAAGKPISLPGDIVLLENEKPIQSDLRVELGERRYNDGYSTCRHCNGEGGNIVNGKTSLCKICGGSGLL